MPWITPIDIEVLSAQSKERASIAAIKGGLSGVPVDDLSKILTEVIAEFRDAIAGRENNLDVDGTVPLGLARYVRDMALWIYITRGVPNNDGIQTKERSDANAAAEKVLQGIRDGVVAIEPPTGWANTSADNWNSENRLTMRTHPIPPPAQQAPPAPPNRPYANPDPNAQGDV